MRFTFLLTISSLLLMITNFAHAGECGGFLAEFKKQKTDPEKNRYFELIVNTYSQCILPLMEAGADPFAPNRSDDYKPFLRRIFFVGDLPTIKYIFERKGFKFSNPPTQNDLRYFYDALTSGHDDVINYVITKNAPINTPFPFAYDEKPLQVAVNIGRLSLVKALVKAGATLGPYKKDEWRHPIAVAIATGHPEIAGYLINSGIPIAPLDSAGSGDPLESAIQFKQYELVKLLVAKGALSVKNSKKDLYLHTAITSLPEIFHYLRFQGLDPKAKDEWGDTLLHKMAREMDSVITPAEIIKTAQKYKININEKDGLGQTILHKILCSLDEASFDLFAKAGADFFTTEGNGFTLLHSAVDCKTSVALQYLITKKLDQNKKDINGRTPLHIAALATLNSNSSTSLPEMLKLGFNANVFDIDDKTPLDLLITKGPRFYDLSLAISHTNLKGEAGLKTLLFALDFERWNAAEKLVNTGVDVKFKTPNGEGILHLSKSRLTLQSLKWLVAHGADPHALNDSGENVLQIAARSNVSNSVITDLIFKYKVDATRTDNAGNTLLHSAAKTGNLNLVDDLLKNTKIDPLATNKDGLTALEVAKKFKPDDKYRRLTYFDLIALLESIEEGPKGIAKSEDQWNQYISAKPSPKLETGELISLKHALSTIFQRGQFKKPKTYPKAPSKDSHPDLKKTYQFLINSDKAAHSITADALEVSDLPLSYYRQILAAARTREALYSRKFKPEAKHVTLIAEYFFAKGTPKKEDYEPFSWLLAKSGMSFDEKMLDVFQFNSYELKKEVASMIKFSPLEMKDFSNIAAIKIAKALLDFPDKDYACDKKDSPVDEILVWFATYANHKDADRLLYAKLIRLVLEKKPVCPADRNLLLGAMRTWKASNAAVQHEIACATSAVFGNDSIPLNERSFTDLVAIIESIGLRADLSEAAWIEQIRALGELSDEDSELYAGLTKYALGNPAGKVATKTGSIKIPETTPSPGALVKLCRIVGTIEAIPNPDSSQSALKKGAHAFFEKLSSELEKPRNWPKGFELADKSKEKLTLRQSFETQKLTDDLKALETKCQTLPDKKKKLTISKTPAPSSKKKHTKPKGDFAP